MLKRLKIKGFQNHKNTDIVFDPHITTIVGPTDSGKSAVIRALQWLTTNRPAGIGYINHGEELTKVTLTLDDHTIKRVRSRGSINSYYLDGKKYVAFKHDIPSDITKALGLGQTNWQNQADAPFWFSETPGNVSKNLNSIIDLGVIDHTLGRLGSAVRTASAMVTATLAIYETAVTARRDAKPAKAAHIALTHVEALWQGYNETSNTARLVDTDLTTLSRHTQTAKDAQDKAAAALAVVKLGQAWATVWDQHIKLMLKVAKLDELKEIADKNITGLDVVEKLYNEAQAAEDKVEQLQNFIAATTTYTNNTKTAIQQAQAAMNDYKKKVGTICPFCQQPLKQK